MSDVVELIREFNRGRDPRLVELKYQLMQTNAFAFFRGTCHLFYQDWPTTSLLNEAPVAWICGDLHLQNLGCYKGDNRLVYFNINDFDEAVLAPCTWDLARFLTCLLVAAPTLKISEAKAFKLCKDFVDVYTKALARGRVRPLDDDNAVGPARELIFQVKHRPRAAFLDAHTEKSGNTRKLLINGKQTLPVTEAERAEVTALMQKWRAQQLNPPFFTLLDVAHRIAGIGSLGVERYVLLVEGKGSPDRNYLLDLKAESSSSLQPYVQVRQPDWRDQAERCVDIQQWVQGIPPALLSAVQMGEKSYILRELQPIEDKVNLEPVTGKLPELEQLVNMIAKVIAWGQLRSAGRQTAADANDLMDFAQSSSGWQKELLRYARNYVVQVNQDYQAFCSAYKEGRLKTD
jgi:uncharacterized protein (DUF2252 family)